MTQTSVGIRELKAQLSRYMRQVKAGATLVITERGEPVGRIVPMSPSAEERLAMLARVGLVAWSGSKLPPPAPAVHTRGGQTVAGLLLEDRE
ncbi:MAG: type II toxin-antitoxin system prevent-host-death family antitoxin [Chloroflexi bacterium]|nr:type II toxin-antitoxin system prevent-host-death family antitoxin [Chloroflexota bacterium]MBU1751065.1 type II toxin-antitoxin system prevent-host-death family antitoxin [Chloroflexota bacterium]MBU1877365.1 type II toxin-antitoxin system prevent-host-death family antitoxin [Chloroflexota bacterium]